jgi:diguanylate cyclase (GGDEF)-like protein/PAS domain S-box-containing protein
VISFNSFEQRRADRPGETRGSPGRGDALQTQLPRRPAPDPHPEVSTVLWQSLLAGVPDGFFFVLDPLGRLRFLSPTAEEILGRELAGLLGRSLEELLTDAAGQDDGRAAALDGDLTLRRYARGDGSVLELAIRSYPVPTEGGDVWGGGYARDVTRQLALQRELSHAATHDALTGLANRPLFEMRLRQVVGRLERDAGARFAILMLDLDGFKGVNDVFGHLAGDRLLRDVANCLSHCVRPGDTVCRAGGDEFLILAEDVECLEDVVRMAERILESLIRPFEVDGRQLSISASVGIVEGELMVSDPGELIRRADAAMYRAKRLGRNRLALSLPAMV